MYLCNNKTSDNREVLSSVSFSHSETTAVSLSAVSRWSEELSAVRSPDASAGSSSPESGKAEYVGTALNMTKPNVMTTNEMMYRVEN